MMIFFFNLFCILSILRVNFKKFEKAKVLPNYDHLMSSSVYKMIHKLEAEPKKGIPARPPIVPAAEDIIERVVCTKDDNFYFSNHIIIINCLL